jgi:hypothetical protein
MSFGRFALVLGMAGALAGGCTVTEETTQVTPDPFPDVATFCAKVAAAVCNQYVVTACYGSDANSLPTDTQSCIDAYSQLAVCNPGNLPFHKDQAANCLAQLQAAYADAKIEAAEVKAVEDACVLVFFTGLGSGSTCTSDSVCNTLGQLRCVIKAGDTDGTCEIPVEVTGGLDCSAPNAQCIEGFYCDGSNCLGMPGEGHACSTTIPCQDTCVCSAATGGVCNLKMANGVQGCTADNDCQSGFCTKATDAATGRCMGTSVLAGTSENCAPFLP